MPGGRLVRTAAALCIRESSWSTGGNRESKRWRVRSICEIPCRAQRSSHARKQAADGNPEPDRQRFGGHRDEWR